MKTFQYGFLLCILAFVVLPRLTLGLHTHLHHLETLSDLQVEIAPRTHHFFEKRQQSANRELEPKKIAFDDHLHISINAYNQTLYLHLEPNIDLFHPEATVIIDGQHQKIHQQPYHQRPLVYKGVVLTPTSNHSLGWARVLVRNDLMIHEQDHPIIEGAFKLNGDLYHIKATTNYNLVKRSDDVPATPGKMVIYRDSDTSPVLKRDDHQHHQCGFDNMLHPALSSSSLVKRDESFFSQNTFSGCPTTRKINYMGAAADCTYVQYYKNVNNARIQIINNFNMASAVFEDTFNVSLGLINITIMDTSCPSKVDPEIAWNRACDATYALNNRLSDFSRWRSKMKNDGAGLWHLMTDCPTGVEVGLAWLRQLCNSGSELQMTADGKEQYVSGAGVSAVTRDEWKVVAHEIGHGFGAIHDCSAADCPCEGADCQCCQLDGDQCQTTGYLMSAISNSSAESFSPCSVKTICRAFPSVATCLYDPEQQKRPVYTLNSCGNGIKEEDEECDTGGEDTPCCDAKTCKFKKDAVCEDKTDGCCHNCQIRPKTHMCRAAATPCDVSEYCTGDSPICPTDRYLRDGTICGLNGLKCASGQCTSRDEQCLSRGFVMNITQSCRTNNEECKLLCNSPDSDKCLIFSGNFIDGTPCGFGGRCHDGECRNGGAVGSSLLYLREHLQVAIPVMLVLFMILCAVGYLLFCYGCWRCPGYKERQRKREYYSSELQPPTTGLFGKRSINILSRLSFSAYLYRDSVAPRLLLSKEKQSLEVHSPPLPPTYHVPENINHHHHSPSPSPVLTASSSYTITMDEKLVKNE